MRSSIRKGFGFGLTSGIITTLGLIIGLNSSTHSKIIVVGGILLIAFADALSDSLGIHISEESVNNNTKELWEVTFATFISKLLIALTFLVPVLLFQLETAIILSIIWGVLLIAVFSYYLAKKQGTNPSHVVLEHVVIAILVIIITHFIGDFISSFS